MNENIDLTEILKDCPIGTKFYHVEYGDVWFCGIDLRTNYSIMLSLSTDISKQRIVRYHNREYLLFPSKDQRDWSKFTAPWYKKEKLVEPIFKVGDWVVRGDTIAQILNIQDQYYIGRDINGKDFVSSRFLNNDKIHLWTIQDAKDGDVLAVSWWEDKNLWEKIIIFKKYHNEGVKGLYSMPCVEGYGNIFKDGKMVFIEEIPYYSEIWTPHLHPATKEQRNFLFKKIKEAGYKWNAETKTLEKLVEVPDKFDPKTLQPFDKVLVRDGRSQTWRCDFFSHVSDNDGDYPYITISAKYVFCIPYNDDTKHLVGTNEEAPEYYRY